MRSGVDASPTSNLIVAENAHLAGGSIILDSSSAMRIEPSAKLTGNSVSLNSGQISLVLSNPGELNAGSGLILYSSVLQNIEASAQTLSLLSYSSFDIYGIGEVGALNSDGQPALASLALHAAEIRGFNNLGGTVFFRAKDIVLDNSASGAPVGAISAPAGGLVFAGDTITIGANQLAVDQYSNLSLAASSGLLLEDLGGLTSQGKVNIIAPLITGAGGAFQSITAGGDLIDVAIRGVTYYIDCGWTGSQPDFDWSECDGRWHYSAPKRRRELACDQRQCAGRRDHRRLRHGAKLF